MPRYRAARQRRMLEPGSLAGDGETRPARRALRWKSRERSPKAGCTANAGRNHRRKIPPRRATRPEPPAFPPPFIKFDAFPSPACAIRIISQRRLFPARRRELVTNLFVHSHHIHEPITNQPGAEPRGNSPAPPPRPPLRHGGNNPPPPARSPAPRAGGRRGKPGGQPAGAPPRPLSCRSKRPNGAPNFVIMPFRGRPRLFAGLPAAGRSTKNFPKDDPDPCSETPWPFWKGSPTPTCSRRGT